jgi:hypothetical protein
MPEISESLLISALAYVSSVKPIVIKRNSIESALRALSLYLKANNPLNDEKSQAIRSKILADFERSNNFESIAIDMIREYEITGYKDKHWDEIMKIVDEL